MAYCCRLTCAAVMVLIIILQAEFEDVRKYYPFFGEQGSIYLSPSMMSMSPTPAACVEFTDAPAPTLLHS